MCIRDRQKAADALLADPRADARSGAGQAASASQFLELVSLPIKRRTILKTRERSREAMTRGSFSPGDIRGAPTYTRGLRDCPSAPHSYLDTSVRE